MLERTEYPRPQFRREAWQPLNGDWEFGFGEQDERALALPLTIRVPFAYEYPASGIGKPSMEETVWYRRTFSVADGNRHMRALLCFNGVDYEADVWLNGRHVMCHIGAYTPFSVDITEYLKDGENELVVRARDPFRDDILRGKQSWTGKPFACWYTPSTGIWQSVWLEFFGEDCVKDYSLFPDFDRSAFYGEVSSLRERADRLEIAASFKGEEVARQSVALHGGKAEYCVHLPHDFCSDYAWSPENPQLIDVDFTLYCGEQRVDLGDGIDGGVAVERVPIKCGKHIIDVSLRRGQRLDLGDFARDVLPRIRPRSADADVVAAARAAHAHLVAAHRDGIGAERAFDDAARGGPLRLVGQPALRKICDRLLLDHISSLGGSHTAPPSIEMEPIDLEFFITKFYHI